jgi:hypothetical protein
MSENSNARVAIPFAALERPSSDGFITLYYGPPKVDFTVKVRALGMTQKAPLLTAVPGEPSFFRVEMERVILNMDQRDRFQEKMAADGVGVLYALWNGLVYLEDVSLSFDSVKFESGRVSLYDVLKGTASGVRHYAFTSTQGSS